MGRPVPERDDHLGPYVVWQDYYTEGWKPTSYDTPEEAIVARKDQPNWSLQKPVVYSVKEATLDDHKDLLRGTRYDVDKSKPAMRAYADRFKRIEDYKPDDPLPDEGPFV